MIEINKKKVKNNQLIKVKITKYGRGYIKECALVEIIGNIDDKDIEIKEVIHRNNLLSEFTDEELNFARNVSQEVDVEDIKNRIDFFC